MDFDVKLEGFSEIDKALKRFPISAEKALTDACYEGARALAEGARASSRTPVDTGRLRASINQRKLGRLAAATFVGVNYARFVHEGTGRMGGRPFLRWAYEDVKRFIDSIFLRAIRGLP